LYGKPFLNMKLPWLSLPKRFPNPIPDEGILQSFMKMADR